MLGDASNRKRFEFVYSCLSSNTPHGHRPSILDIGCGKGDIEVFLGQKGYQEITGLDIDSNSIETARKRCEKFGHKFHRTSVEDFSVNDKWDVIICSEVLEHLEKPENLIKRLHTLLKKNGALIISVPNGYGPWEVYHRYSERDKYNALEKQPAGKYHLQRFTFKRIISIFNSNGFSLVTYRNSNSISHVWPFSILGYRSYDFFEIFDCQVADFLPRRFSSGWYFCFQGE